MIAALQVQATNIEQLVDHHRRWQAQARTAAAAASTTKQVDESVSRLFQSIQRQPTTMHEPFLSQLHV